MKVSSPIFFGSPSWLNTTSKTAIAIALCLFTAPSYAWTLFGPKNYDECILEGMKGVTSDTAAGAVIHACSNKFSATTKSCSPIPLVKAEYANMEFNGSSSYRVFKLRVYNAHKTKAIHSVLVELAAKNIDPPQAYTVDFYPPVPPQSSGEGSAVLIVEPSDDKTLRILEIRGCQEK